MVPQIYKNYVGRIADTLAKTLAFDAVTQQVLPPMPTESEQAVHEWHLRVLRIQHASMVGGCCIRSPSTSS